MIKNIPMLVDKIQVFCNPQNCLAVLHVYIYIPPCWSERSNLFFKETSIIYHFFLANIPISTYFTKQRSSLELLGFLPKHLGRDGSSQRFFPASSPTFYWLFWLVYFQQISIDTLYVDSLQGTLVPPKPVAFPLKHDVLSWMTQHAKKH